MEGIADPAVGPTVGLKDGSSLGDSEGETDVVGKREGIEELVGIADPVGRAVGVELGH